MSRVAVSDFVRRQVAGSGKTWSPDLSFEAIAAHAQCRLTAGYSRPGYRDGVVIVEAAPEFIKHFRCPLVKIDESTRLKTRLVHRRPDEKPYLQTRALNGTPLAAGRVEFILYRHVVLMETNDQSSDAEWELISIHAVPEGEEQLPMGPVTMMRNQLELPGGTKARYSPDEWAEAVRFWQLYAALEPDVTD